jgi:hypothetical protein
VGYPDAGGSVGCWTLGRHRVRRED